MSNQKGFTLIESLIVLSIFMVLTMITAISIKPQYFLKDDELFLNQLSADILYGQQYALSHQCEISIVFKETEYKYLVITKSDRPPLLERPYAKNIEAFGGSLPLVIKFLPDGNISKFGTFYVRVGDKPYKYTFLIGKGRFYVTSEK